MSVHMPRGSFTSRTESLTSCGSRRMTAPFSSCSRFEPYIPPPPLLGLRCYSWLNRQIAARNLLITVGIDLGETSTTIKFWCVACFICCFGLLSLIVCIVIGISTTPNVWGIPKRHAASSHSRRRSPRFLYGLSCYLARMFICASP